MLLQVLKNTVLIFVLIGFSCGKSSRTTQGARPNKTLVQAKEDTTTIIVGANQTDAYLPLLKGKTIGVVANQTSVIFKDHYTYTHLVDSLITLNVKLKKVFAPEHGFRGTADAGEHVKDGLDTQTGLPIISLYGKNRKPSAAQLRGIDLMVFDIQDVGVRFYTYISTLHYVMEACAENNIPLLILDRPNPNGHFIDGPILETKHQSFVGMHPIPVAHGMTIGEYAQMINGEQWLNNGITCKLDVISLKHYQHSKPYKLPIKPSPNLPNSEAINLYPSLCFFEGTNVNAGRGTNQQFQVFGSPYLNSSFYTYRYTPQPNEGSKHPKHEGKLCYGKQLENHPQLKGLELQWLIDAYENTADKDAFFNLFFTKLAGTTLLQSQIESGLTTTEIKASWQNGLTKFKTLREQYLIYN